MRGRAPRARPHNDDSQTVAANSIPRPGPIHIRCCRSELAGAAIDTPVRVRDDMAWCACCDRILSPDQLAWVATSNNRRILICPDCAGCWL